ncbi:MAG: hypothetical protein HY319_12430 [Armatimonadetes bacterium]|nr:hypothetical protein [Armatimonadota bacterium]
MTRRYRSGRQRKSTELQQLQPGDASEVTCPYRLTLAHRGLHILDRRGKAREVQLDWGQGWGAGINAAEACLSPDQDLIAVWLEIGAIDHASVGWLEKDPRVFLVNCRTGRQVGLVPAPDQTRSLRVAHVKWPEAGRLEVTYCYGGVRSREWRDPPGVWKGGPPQPGPTRSYAVLDFIALS